MGKLRLTGNTFLHRETIRLLGGKWEAETKSWLVSDKHREEISRLTGVNVSEVAELPNAPKWEAPKPVERITFGNHIGGSEFFGKIESTKYAEFSSLNDLAEHVLTNRHPMDISGTFHFDNHFGTYSLGDAIKLAKEGWLEGVKFATEIKEFINVRNPVRRDRSYGVAGGSVNVGRMLAGNPLSMRRRTKQPSEKIITLYTHVGARATVSQDAMKLRAAIVAAVVDNMENNGYSVEVIAISNNCNSGIKDKITKRYVTATVLKRAGDHMNLSDIVFGCGHPSMHRRFVFSIIADFGNDLPSEKGYTNSIEIDEPNVYVINNVPQNFKMTEDTVTNIRRMVKAICPANLPVTFNV